jgi:hypothetical protein
MTLLNESLAPEHAPIAAVVQQYIDGYLGQDPALLRRAFQASAQLMTVDEGAFSAGATAAWFDRIEAKRESGGGPLPARRHRILGIDRAGRAAVAKVSLELEQISFTDYLALLETDSGWQIVNKIYEATAL